MVMGFDDERGIIPVPCMDCEDAWVGDLFDDEINYEQE